MLEEIDERNALRDERILDAAARLIRRDGLDAITRRGVAEEAGLSDTSVSHFGRTRLSNGTHDSRGYRERILQALTDRAARNGEQDLIRVGIVLGYLREA